jgi:hypothetical protein
MPSVQSQGFPGLPLQQQPAHTRLKVLLVLQILQVLKSWGVAIHNDAALAAALQVLRFCWDTEDARQSGRMTPRVGLRAAVDLVRLSLGQAGSLLQLRVTTLLASANTPLA